MRFIIILLLLSVSLAANAINKPVVEYLYKKDAAYGEILDEFWGGGRNATMVVTVGSNYGHFLWIFEKERKEEIRKISSSDSTVVKYHNIYAYILIEDHGGTLERAKFQDFGNEVYSPEFQYPYCQVDDADNNGMPEFYLTYFGSSDGLDAKPLKVIVYTANKAVRNTFEKSKATAWYPGGNEEDVYHVEYDANWNKLPKTIQARGMKILNEIKSKNILGE